MRVIAQGVGGSEAMLQFTDALDILLVSLVLLYVLLALVSAVRGIRPYGS